MSQYIFIVGAPGSKWSSVAKNIYFSSSIDQTDQDDSRTYSHKATGSMQPMHVGAYFDPGMEFGKFFNTIDVYSKEYCEEEFNRPFSGTGTRIIKSHTLSHNINFLKQIWPDCPVVLVHRSNDSCLGWWVRCGGFDITYPDYSGYYQNLKNMALEIDRQNADILTAWDKYHGFEVDNNQELAAILKISTPPTEYQQNYPSSDIRVKVI